MRSAAGLSTNTTATAAGRSSEEIGASVGAPTDRFSRNLEKSSKSEVGPPTDGPISVDPKNLENSTGGSWIPADQAKSWRTDLLGRRIDPNGRFLLDLVRRGEGFTVYRGKLRDGQEHEFFCWESEAAKLAGRRAPPDPTERRPRHLSRTALGKIANNVRNEVAALPGSPAGRKWLLKRRATPFQRERVRTCRHKRTVKNSVQVSTDGTGVAITGIETCGSARDCPVCAPNIYAARAAEIVKACTSHRGRRGLVLMLTLTVRHQGSNDLKWLSSKVSEAYRSMRRSRRFQRLWRDQLGIRWVIRGDEQNHGPNGWHPHLHVLLFVPEDSKLAEQAREAAKNKKPLNARTSDLLYPIYERWSERVEAVLGSAFVPTVERGVVVTVSTDDEYIAKLGLEVAFITEKRGRTDKHRTPWELLQDATDGDLPAQKLWREHSAAMLGRRQISWSRGMKQCFMVDEKTDEELAQEQLDRMKERTTFDIAAWLWDYLNRSQPLWVACFVERVRRSPAEAEELLPPKGTTAGDAWTRKTVKPHPDATGPPRDGPEAYAHEFALRRDRQTWEWFDDKGVLHRSWQDYWRWNRANHIRGPDHLLRFKGEEKKEKRQFENLDDLQVGLREAFPDEVASTLPGLPCQNHAPNERQNGTDAIAFATTATGTSPTSSTCIAATHTLGTVSCPIASGVSGGTTTVNPRIAHTVHRTSLELPWFKNHHSSPCPDSPLERGPDVDGDAD